MFASVMGAEARPGSLDLRPFLPPVGNQGKQGSCAGWATGYYAYTCQQAIIKHRTPEELLDAENQCSPAFIYNIGRVAMTSQDDVDPGDGGISLGLAFAVLTELGCASLADMPYDETTDSVLPDETALVRAGRQKARAAAVLCTPEQRASVDQFKTYLADTGQPFVVGLPIYPNFPSLEDQISEEYVYSDPAPPAGHEVEQHALAVVGYDDTKHAFLLVNSWSEEWGNHGFLWIDENFVADYCIEAWGCVAGGWRARSDPRSEASLRSPGGHISVAPPEEPGAILPQVR